MANNFESRIAELERQHGGNSCKGVLLEGDETTDEAQARAGLTDWPGAIIFMSEADAKL